jgi:hypothetical protein
VKSNLIFVVGLFVLGNSIAIAQESAPVPNPTESPAAVSELTAPQPAAASTPEAVETSDEDYEVDYEEEGDLPPPKKSSKKAGTAGEGKDPEPTTQGSRAKNRFSVPAKSETKSIYKKNGVSLDVDSD